MKREEYNDLFGEEKQRVCDSLLGDQKDGEYHLESQHGEKTRATRPEEGSRKKWLGWLLVIGLLAFWTYCFLPKSWIAADESTTLGEDGWSWEAVSVWQCLGQSDRTNTISISDQTIPRTSLASML